MPIHDQGLVPSMSTLPCPLARSSTQAQTWVSANQSASVLPRAGPMTGIRSRGSGLLTYRNGRLFNSTGVTGSDQDLDQRE